MKAPQSASQSARRQGPAGNRKNKNKPKKEGGADHPVARPTHALTVVLKEHT